MPSNIDQPRGEVGLWRDDGAEERRRRLDGREAGADGRRSEHRRGRRRQRRLARRGPRRRRERLRPQAVRPGRAADRGGVRRGRRESRRRRMLVGDKSPTGTGVYAKVPGEKRVLLVSSSLETSVNKSTFDLRDKTALKIRAGQGGPGRAASKNQTIRLGKSGDELENAAAQSRAGGLQQRRGPHRAAPVGADDVAQGQARGPQGSEGSTASTSRK